jgi:hypothetical protein
MCFCRGHGGAHHGAGRLCRGYDIWDVVNNMDTYKSPRAFSRAIVAPNMR